MRRGTGFRAAFAAVVCAMGAPAGFGQIIDPNLDPNHPGVEDPFAPENPPDGWQLHQEECIDGRLYLVVEDARAYLEQMGWDPLYVRVYPREATGLSKDLILAPTERQRKKRCEPTGVRVSSSFSMTQRVQVTMQWTGGRWEVTSVKREARKGEKRVRREAGPPIDGQYSPGYAEEREPPEFDEDGNPVAIETAAPLTILELARVELGVGDAGQAVNLYKGHLEADPEDVRARRELGVALLKSGEAAEAAVAMLEAYARDPAIADEPIGMWVVGESEAELAGLRRAIAGHANRSGTAGAWLTMAVLMQAEGKPGPALKTLERAEKAGLDAEVARAMRGALTGA